MWSIILEILKIQGLGVVAGVMLTHLLARGNNEKTRRDTLRETAYSDFFLSLMSLSHAQALKDSDKIIAADAAYLSAQTRVIMYGSSDVMACFMKWQRAHVEAHNTPVEVQALGALCEQMRAESATGKRFPGISIMEAMGAKKLKDPRLPAAEQRRRLAVPLEAAAEPDELEEPEQAESGAPNRLKL